MTPTQLWTVVLLVASFVLLGIWLAGVDAELRAMKGLAPRQMPDAEAEEHA